MRRGRSLATLLLITTGAVAQFAAQSPSLADEVVTGRESTVRGLIAHGADVNEQDEAGITPLMRAASAGRGEMVRLLLEKGAKVNARTNGGATALMMACLGGSGDVVDLLLSHKADATLRDAQGRTALMAAAANGDEAVVAAVLRTGADMSAVDGSGGTALTYAAAEGRSAALAFLQKNGAKADDADLLLAASGCSTAIVQSFLASGMPADGAQPGGQTPLHAAASHNCVDTVRLLAERGANLNAKDHDGWTPLIRASEAGHVDVVRLLLDKGADMNVADSAGRTAWMYAAMGNYTDIAALFKLQRQARGASKRDPSMLEVGSPALKADQPMPREYTADGRNVSPPLTWSPPPEGTKSLAVVCEDPDAGNPPPFVHWVIYNIPPTATGLPENVPFEPGAALPAGISGAVQGLSGFRRPIYRGPAPPPGKPHHYHFVVYAVDLSGLRPALTRAELLQSIKDHVLASGEIVVTYERKP